MLFRVKITKKWNNELQEPFECVLPTEVLFARFQCPSCVIIEILEVINE